MKEKEDDFDTKCLYLRDDLQPWPSFEASECVREVSLLDIGEEGGPKSASVDFVLANILYLSLSEKLSHTIPDHVEVCRVLHGEGMW